MNKQHRQNSRTLAERKVSPVSALISAATALCLVGGLWAAGAAVPGIPEGVPGKPEVVRAAALSDIKGHRSEALIQEAVSLGVIKGYPDGAFRPDGLLKREEFFSIISNILTERPDTSGVTLKFIDVDPAEWYVPVVKTMVAGKISQGIGWEKMGIGQIITRQEAVKILAGIIPVNTLPTTPVTMQASDKGDIDAWALSSYEVLIKKGYLANNTGKLGPKMALTREEAAILLLKIKKNETIIAGNATHIAVDRIRKEQASGGCGEKGHAISDGGFTSGKGTIEQPYLISTQEQLYHILAHRSEGVCFALSDDIRITKDFETEKENRFSGTYTKDQILRDWCLGNFRPLGTEDSPFKGTLDGRGHSIEGLNIIGAESVVTGDGSLSARTAASLSGLLGVVSEGSVVKNLTVKNSVFSGKNKVGALTGVNHGTIQNCGAGDNVLLMGGESVGGLTGINHGILSSCYMKGSLMASGDAGALAGKNNGTVKNCYWLHSSFGKPVGTSGSGGTLEGSSGLTPAQFAEQKIELLTRPR